MEEKGTLESITFVKVANLPDKTRATLPEDHGEFAELRVWRNSPAKTEVKSLSKGQTPAVVISKAFSGSGLSSEDLTIDY